MYWCFEYYFKFGNVERIEKRNFMNDECINLLMYNFIYWFGKFFKVLFIFIWSISLWRNVGVSSEWWFFYGYLFYFFYEFVVINIVKELLIFYIFNM